VRILRDEFQVLSFESVLHFAIVIFVGILLDFVLHFLFGLSPRFAILLLIPFYYIAPSHNCIFFSFLCAQHLVVYEKAQFHVHLS
jgi:TctA family transporter